MSVTMTNMAKKPVTVGVWVRDPGAEGERRAIKPGDTVTSFRGEDATFNGITRFGRTGTAKVSVSCGDEFSPREYYASVFNLIVEGENDDAWLAERGL